MSKNQISAYLNLEEVEEMGMTQVIFVRDRANGLSDIFAFLVDSQCLGVKNAMYKKGATEHEVRDLLDGANHSDDTNIPAANAKAFVEGAVSYAKKLGFIPHRDYRKARSIFARIKEGWDEPFTYGNSQSGKPVYISGPHDTQQFINRVMKTLERNTGEGEYEHVVPYDGLED